MFTTCYCGLWVPFRRTVAGLNQCWVGFRKWHQVLKVVNYFTSWSTFSRFFFKVFLKYNSFLNKWFSIKPWFFQTKKRSIQFFYSQNPGSLLFFHYNLQFCDCENTQNTDNSLVLNFIINNKKTSSHWKPTQHWFEVWTSHKGQICQDRMNPLFTQATTPIGYQYFE